MSEPSSWRVCAALPSWRLCAALLAVLWVGGVARSAEHLPDGPVLDRDAFRDAVLAAHPGVAAAADAVTAAQERRRGARAWEDPMIGLELAPLSLAGEAPGVTVRARQALPAAGLRAARVDGTGAALDMATAEEGEVRRMLAREALRTWDRWYGVHRALEVNTHHREILEELEAAARAGYGAGRAPVTAPLAAEMESALLERELLALDVEKVEVRVALNTLLRRPPGAAQPPPPGTLPLGPDLSLDPGDPLADRSELQGLDAALAMARADTAMARAERLPMAALMASYSTMWMDPNHRLMVGVETSLPFGWAAASAEVRAALAEEQRIGQLREQASDAVRAEVEIALARARGQRAAAELQTYRLVPLAKERLAAAQAGFAAGTTDFDAVIEAERQLREAELDRERLTVGWLDALAALDDAAGRMPSTPVLKEVRDEE